MTRTPHQRSKKPMYKRDVDEPWQQRAAMTARFFPRPTLRTFTPDDWVKYPTAEYISENRPPLIGQIKVDGRVADVVRDRGAIGVYWFLRGRQYGFVFQHHLGRVRKALRTEMTSRELRDLGGETVVGQE